ncbi:MAG: hydrogenase maturation nickel metallochaperone HypA [Candidatus Aenigmarchaeota archaeon]|nr:hydrogenase maturation nickel metallochaperone HypA [Candidatus Aenigmarchaeota archaeon]
MHDISVAQAVADAIMKSLRGKVPRRLDIELELGKLRFHDPEQVRFWIDEILKKELGNGLEIKTGISIIDPVIKCACGFEGVPEDSGTDPDLAHHVLLEVRCPECGSAETSVKNGNECRLSKLSFS